MKRQHWAWATIVLGIIWTYWCIGMWLTRSSSYAADPTNPAFRILTPWVIAAMTLGGVGITIFAVVVLYKSGRSEVQQ